MSVAWAKAEVWGKEVPELRGRNTERARCRLEPGRGGRAKKGEASRRASGTVWLDGEQTAEVRGLRGLKSFKSKSDDFVVNTFTNFEPVKRA
jgi:hypothetical protein